MEIVVGGRPARIIRAPKQRVLLAALLLRPNRFISTHELIDILWQTNQPVDARAALQVHVTRVRHALELSARNGSQPIRTLDDGYLMDVPPDGLDLSLFDTAVERAKQARATADLAGEDRALNDALALWRGEVLADIPCERLQQEEARWLNEQRLQVTERRFDVDLELGRHQDVLPQIEAQVDRNPLRERLWAQLITALYRCGQQARALEKFHAVRRLLDDELGIEPGPELGVLHQTILTGGPAPASQRASTSTTGGGVMIADAPLAAGTSPAWRTQCQLPADAADFVGRTDLLETFAGLIVRADRGNVPPVVMLVGSPGTGKSAFAIHLAHRVRSEFPDGQWYVRLGGSNGMPSSPAGVMAELLRASGLADAWIPTETEALAATFRARLADHRVLLVLDDASDTAQIAPLLPGTPGCAVLVTSRYDLTDMVALHNARSVSLGELPPAEAVALLARSLGESRVRAEPQAAAELAELSGCLPLALRIAAAILNRRKQQGIGEYIAELRKGNRLRHFAVGGTAAVRAAFDQSYTALDSEHRRLFRLLGLMPVQHFTVRAVSALMGISVDEAARRLEELAMTHLIECDDTGRFRFHGLLRYYAAERASAENTPAERDAILSRLFEWYVGSAIAAVRMLYPDVMRVRLPRPATKVRIASFPDEGSAQSWLRTEGINLLVTLRHAVDFSCPSLGWQFVDALRSYFGSVANNSEWVAAAKSGLRAAIELDNQRAIVAMRFGLGLALRCSGHYAQAEPYLADACSDARKLGMRDFECAALSGIGILRSAAGRPESALDPLRDALAVARQSDFQLAEARALRNLGSVYHDLGQLHRAHRAFTAALALNRRLGVWHYQADNLNEIGFASAELGWFDEAADCFHQALDLGTDLEVRHDQAKSYCGLALTHRRTGNIQDAISHAGRAVRLAREIKDHNTEIIALSLLGTAYRAAGELESAKDCYLSALHLPGTMGHERIEAEILTGLAQTYRLLGCLDQAAECAHDAVRITTQGGLLLSEARARTALVAVQRELGQMDQARDNASRTLAIQRRSGCYLEPAPWLLVQHQARQFSCGVSPMSVPARRTEPDQHRAARDGAGI